MIVIILGIIGLIISRFNHSERLKDISICVILWASLFFLLPRKAIKSGLIKSKFKAWLVAFMSPPALIIVLFVGFFVSLPILDRPTPLSKEETPYTSYEEIVSITGISNFPEFEYLSSSERHGYITIKYAFKDAKEVENLYKTLKRMVNNEENPYWSIDSTTNYDYNFSRGWDGEYIDIPANCSYSFGQIEIDIDSTGFTAWDTSDEVTFGLDPLDIYANADSLCMLTGIRFPKYKVVNMNGWHNSWAGESGSEFSLMLDKKPTKSFLEALSKSDKWTRNEEGLYEFYKVEGNKYRVSHNISVDPFSRIIRIDYAVL